MLSLQTCQKHKLYTLPYTSHPLSVGAQRLGSKALLKPAQDMFSCAAKRLPMVGPTLYSLPCSPEPPNPNPKS